MEDIIKSFTLLKEADLILAEDTRVSSVLLNYYDISKRVESYHLKRALQKLRIIEKLRTGITIAMIWMLAHHCRPWVFVSPPCLEAGQGKMLTWPTALIPAIVQSGLPCDRFILKDSTHKKGRVNRLKIMAKESRTLVFYESPHKLLKLFEQMIPFGIERRLAVIKEISKIYEETFRGTSEELNYFLK